ncbi:hypothetical protein [Helicobacter didelphidarum]|uniref:hypothetical protein n=1 Tax=Helicobacter didelphidarum TaxID=2040648 RepID=UPI0038B36DEB
MKETSINTESSKLISQKTNDTINKDKIKRDSHGDEIVYEVRHNPNWWDYIMYFMMLFFGIAMAYGSTESLLFNEEIDKSLPIAALAFGIMITLMCSYRLFYVRKNRFYVTTRGIGFERRHWFRMQKGFYRFGEAGAIRHIGSTLNFPVTPPNLIIIFPLGNRKRKYYASWQLKPYCNISLTAWDIYVSQKIYNKASDTYHQHDFLIKKTKEALEAKGIDTKTLCYDLDKQFDIY